MQSPIHLFTIDISPGLLFHTINADTAASIKITVHTEPIVAPDGVKDGKLMVAYHSMPFEVTLLPVSAANKTAKGIMM